MRWLFILLALAGCQDHFRYPCQDPDNWKNKECNPPVCEASQTCTSDVLGYQPQAKGNK